MAPPMIMMRSPFDILLVELVYFAVITFFCSIIYHRTSKIYELTKHEGIWFFRNTFLYFGLAYFFRFVQMFITFFLNLFLDVHLRGFFSFNWVFFGFFSTMAVISLAVTAVHRHIRIEKRKLDFMIYLVSIFATLTGFFMNHQFPLMIIQSCVVLATLLFQLLNYKEFRKITQTRIIYYSLLMFWIINFLPFAQSPFTPFFRTVIYAVSVFIFMITYWRVKNKLKLNGKEK